MKLFSITVIAFVIPLIISVGLQLENGNSENTLETPKLKRSNLSIWKDTPVWDLALAVKSQNITTIEKLAIKNPELLNYRESKYGLTLLIWSVGVGKYKSTEALLKCGADQNITTPYGETALYLASGYNWVYGPEQKDPKYVNLLLKYGANPNINLIGKDSSNPMYESGRSPLMQSIGCGIDKTKALIDGGADINNKTITGMTAAVWALFTDRYPEYAYYLIVEKKAKVTDLYFTNLYPKKKFYPIEILRDWICDLDSPEYKMKMEIVKEFKRQGVDYWKTRIPDEQLQLIKKLYPDTWKEYIKKY